MSEIERIVVASTGGWSFVSTRYRLGPLAGAGRWPMRAIAAEPYPSAEQVSAIAAAGGPGAVLILQRVLPDAAAMSRLRAVFAHIVFDLDDAIYAAPPRVRASAATRGLLAARRLALRGSPTASSRSRPLARTLSGVDVCVIGNAILGEFVGSFAPRVVEIPTTTAPVARPPVNRPATPVVVWLGVRDNLQYLELIRSALERLASEHEYRLRIVSTATWDDAPVPVEYVPFTEDAARDALMTASVGVSPLTDDRWTRGKCAMRVIQYGGHALPSVATPVGVTDRIVLDGETGLLARSPADWLASLRSLLGDPVGAHRMGVRALDRITRLYSDDVALRRWQELIEGLDGA